MAARQGGRASFGRVAAFTRAVEGLCMTNVIKQRAERPGSIYRLHVCLDREGGIERHSSETTAAYLEALALSVWRLSLWSFMSRSHRTVNPSHPDPNRTPSLSCRSRSQFRSGYCESPHQCDGTELDLRRARLCPFPREGNTLSVIGYRSGHTRGRPAASWSTASSHVP